MGAVKMTVKKMDTKAKTTVITILLCLILTVGILSVLFNPVPVVLAQGADNYIERLDFYCDTYGELEMNFSINVDSFTVAEGDCPIPLGAILDTVGFGIYETSWELYKNATSLYLWIYNENDGQMRELAISEDTWYDLFFHFWYDGIGLNTRCEIFVDDSIMVNWTDTGLSYNITDVFLGHFMEFTDGDCIVYFDDWELHSTNTDDFDLVEDFETDLSAWDVYGECGISSDRAKSGSSSMQVPYAFQPSESDPDVLFGGEAAKLVSYDISVEEFTDLTSNITSLDADNTDQQIQAICYDSGLNMTLIGLRETAVPQYGSPTNGSKIVKLDGSGFTELLNSGEQIFDIASNGTHFIIVGYYESTGESYEYGRIWSYDGSSLVDQTSAWLGGSFDWALFCITWVDDLIEISDCWMLGAYRSTGAEAHYTRLETDGTYTDLADLQSDYDWGTSVEPTAIDYNGTHVIMTANYNMDDDIMVDEHGNGTISFLDGYQASALGAIWDVRASGEQDRWMFTGGYASEYLTRTFNGTWATVSGQPNSPMYALDYHYTSNTWFIGGESCYESNNTDMWTLSDKGGYLDFEVYAVRSTYGMAAVEAWLYVDAAPEIGADWELAGTPYVTPYSDWKSGTYGFEATELLASRDSGQNRYRFLNWSITNSSGTFYDTSPTTTQTIASTLEMVLNYESYTVIVSSEPEINVGFTATGSPFTTPTTLQRENDTHTFVATDFEVSVNASYKYTFDHWEINGSGYYGSLNIDVDIQADTNLTIVYLGSWVETPFIPSFTATAVNGTWYFRSDDHTIHEILAYKLDFVNSYTSTYDSRTQSGTHDVSYGIRVWILDIFGNPYELTGGTPEAIVTRSADAEGYQSAYFSCPAYGGLIDAVQVNVYQRFGSEPWSLRRYFVTGEDLYIKLPESSWQIYYYTNRTVASTTGYFFHGSSSYSSRILFQYFRANPWEIAMARLQAGNYFGFLFTPWTYYLGDIFWTLLLLFGIVTAYNRFGSLKPILALLWLFGGVGSFLSAMIPAIALSVAWLMLALAMGITLFKLIYR